MTKLDLTPEQRTEFLRSLHWQLREYFPGCAVIVAVASNENQSLSLAAGGPDPADVCALASQVADEIVADLMGRASSGEPPS